MIEKTLSTRERELLYGRVWKELESWGGFKVLSKLLRELPQLRVFLAGGTLRNILLDKGNRSKDFDLFIMGVEIRSVIAILREGGRLDFGPFGSPRWHPSGENDRYCDIVHIGHFYNGLGRCTDIVDALKQFDFTANALAIDIRTGFFFDPLNGLRDIQNSIMRSVRFDYPDEPISPFHSISRLAVLWFRILHYAVENNLQIEPVTLSWLLRNQSYITQLGLFTEVFFKPNIGTIIHHGRQICEEGHREDIISEVTTLRSE